MKSIGQGKSCGTTKRAGSAGTVPPLELSGRWDGYYTQHDSMRRITAEFTHDASRLLGFMSDACTRIEGNVSDLMVEQQMPPGTDERIVARIRSMCPGLDAYPVKTLIEIPPLSTIVGQVERTRVEFRKTYRGEFFAGYQVGDRRIGLRGTDQEVIYHGRLNADGTEITGRWRVENIGKAGSFSHRSTGSFVLRRAPASCLAKCLRDQN